MNTTSRPGRYPRCAGSGISPAITRVASYVGPKFAHLAGKTLGTCSVCHKELTLTARGNVPQHKPQEA